MKKLIVKNWILQNSILQFQSIDVIRDLHVSIQGSPCWIKLLMVTNGCVVCCTTVTVFDDVSSNFSGFLSSPFVPFSFSEVLLFCCPCFLIGSFERTGDSCGDWVCDRLLLSPPSGVCRVSSEDRRNLLKLSLRTSECDFFFFFFFKIEDADFGSSSCCDCCQDISEVKENRESSKIVQLFENYYSWIQIKEIFVTFYFNRFLR